MLSLKKDKKKAKAIEVGALASAIGRGLVAGAAGTAAMTAVSTAEAKLRGRGASSAPADAAGKVLGVEPTGEQEQARFSNVVHWSYGTGWGAARGVIDQLGLHGTPAAVAHFAAVWGSGLLMLPALRVAPAPTQWGAEELALDALHHAVYAGTASVAYGAITR